MPQAFSIEEAKTQFSRLVALAESGEEVELRRNKVPVARLVPIARGTTTREPGALAGQIEMADDFDSLPEDIAESLGLVS